MKKLCPTSTLRSLFHSHLTYGILVWGLAKTTLTYKIFMLQKRAICVVAKADFVAHTDPLFHDLNILKCTDQYLLNLASTMWDYDHESIPKSLNACFNKPKHCYNTRFVKQNKITPCLLVLSSLLEGTYNITVVTLSVVSCQLCTFRSRNNNAVSDI